MRFIRFFVPGEGAKLGCFTSGSEILDLTTSSGGSINSILELLKIAKEDGCLPEKILDMYKEKQSYRFNYDQLAEVIDTGGDKPHLLLPVIPPEVWAAGVTYKRSVDARMDESVNRNVYDLVYHAERPEIFFKSTSSRVVGYGETIGLRSDSSSIVPEPELGVVLGEGHSIIGYIIGNDLTCRDIEGENPLYLPQAKIFNNSCSLGPIVALSESITDPYSLFIECSIYRNNEVVFSDKASTSELNRKLEDLIAYLSRDNYIYPGTVLLTGTCIVPPEDFCLLKDDIVKISIDHMGTLVNKVG